jgi:hypothetical protein
MQRADVTLPPLSKPHNQLSPTQLFDALHRKGCAFANPADAGIQYNPNFP